MNTKTAEELEANSWHTFHYNNTDSIIDPDEQTHCASKIRTNPRIKIRITENKEAIETRRKKRLRIESTGEFANKYPRISEVGVFTREAVTIVANKYVFYLDDNTSYWQNPPLYLLQYIGIEYFNKHRDIGINAYGLSFTTFQIESHPHEYCAVLTTYIIDPQSTKRSLGVTMNKKEVIELISRMLHDGLMAWSHKAYRLR
jgi:hypothetical protein